MAARDRYRVNTWYDVPVKKGQNNSNNQKSNNLRDGVKFFVSNLPEKCSSADLTEVLKRYGDVQGTYIARKYDRLGKRFGSATFKVVRNRADLEESLKDVWIGSYKLFIVPARFVDGQKVDNNKGKEIDKTVHGERVWKPVQVQDTSNTMEVETDVETMNVDKGPIGVSERRSFKDSLLNKEVEVTVPEVVVDSEGISLSKTWWSGLILLVAI